MIQIGQTIPEFSFDYFHAGQIKKGTLSSYMGLWLVFLFYPADFTFVCPTELAEADAYYHEFKKIHTEIVSISTDTVYAHKAWHDASPVIKKVSFPMAADPGGKICRAFGTYLDEEGLSTRATYIIDPDGIVKSVEMHDNSIGRNIREILRKLQAAQYIREHKTEVCPASWRPGVVTLKPGVQLVGKI